MLKLSILILVAVFFIITEASQSEWTKFKQRNGKSKKYTGQEDKIRYAFFKKTLSEVNACKAAHDNKTITHSCQLNNFADWSEGEKRMLFGYKERTLKISKVKRDFGKPIYLALTPEDPFEVKVETFTADPKVKVPESFDVIKAKPNPPAHLLKCRDQMSPVSCGCCFAMASAHVMELATFHQTGRSVQLQEQEILDCTYNLFQGSFNGGCEEGGHPGLVMGYTQKHGLSSSGKYNYNGKEAKCDEKKRDDASKRFKIKTIIKPGKNLLDIQQALIKYGACTMAFESVGSFNNIGKDNVYEGKNLQGKPECTGQPNHAMTIMGYKTIKGKVYLQVKNSWKCSWAVDGIVYILPSVCNASEEIYCPEVAAA